MIMNTEVPTYISIVFNFWVFWQPLKLEMEKSYDLGLGIAYEYIFGTNDAIYHLHFWLRHVESNQQALKSQKKFLFWTTHFFLLVAKWKKKSPSSPSFSCLVAMLLL